MSIVLNLIVSKSTRAKSLAPESTMSVTAAESRIDALVESPSRKSPRPCSSYPTGGREKAAPSYLCMKYGRRCCETEG